MNATFRSLPAIAAALALSASLSAKGPTTRIAIAGDSLTKPIEITDARIVDAFQIWSGPGTTSCIGGRANCADATDGFIVDWSVGVVAGGPAGLQHTKCRSTRPRQARRPGGPERLAYVVGYEYDPVASQGYVYLPGKGEQWYAINVASIYRGREGNWFRGTRAWQDAVVPLIVRRPSVFLN